MRSSIICLATVLACALIVAPAAAVRQEEDTNPITRVAELLQGLAKKVEEDGKAEESLYIKFKCWCKTVANAKAASIDAAKSRIEELESYIDDLKNGRVELTSERTDLEKQEKELNTSIEEATDLRNKEHDDFLAAEDEMKKAIAALEKAVDVMSKGTEGSLASVAVHIKQAMAVGKDLMSSQDADFLAKVLETPQPDWKKLNRKATFKSKYNKRSGKIQEVLSNMLQTFEDNLKDATEKEAEAAKTFGALMKSKNSELEAVQQALEDMAKEKGARGKALADSQEELDDNTENLANDQKFVKETAATCEKRAGEWSERKMLRFEEIKSINEAISILRSDDARDTFKRSLASQSFVQLATSQTSVQAAELLAQVAHQTGSAHMMALAVSVGTQGHFDKVISKIDAMVADLEKEEAGDLAKKEDCESDRMENTQEAKMQSKAIDTNTANIAHFEANIAEKKEQIKVAEEDVKQLEEELQKAADQRNQERAEHKLSKADDESAIELVDRAVGVLKAFYEKNGLNLMQQPAAGEAPPPPPATWDQGYGGSKGEQQGIVAILEMISGDIQKDMDKAQAEEDDAQKRFDDFEKETNESVDSLNKKITDLDGEVGNLEEKVSGEKEQKTATEGQLKETLAYLKKVAPGCDFIAVNFEVRNKNRQAEVDGLKKAKAILSGAAFPSGPNPNRAMKPGDAFMQAQ